MIIIIAIIVVSILTYFLFIVVSISNNKVQDRDINQTSAPPYDGQPVVSYDDQTDNQLYHALGGDEYISTKYFIGEYLHSKGIPIDPIPRVTVSNYTNDIQFLGTIGAYKGVYTFDVYSKDINSSFSVTIEEFTENSTKTISIPSVNFSKDLNSYQYERDLY